jgi:hypothetical protein
VERRELRELVDCRFDVRSDERRTAELQTAVDDAMADQVETARFV